jgi:hypothetical protein
MMSLLFLLDSSVNRDRKITNTFQKTSTDNNSISIRTPLSGCMFELSRIIT